jgi:serine/threonine protein kinase
MQGQRIGPYHLQNLIGQGGQSVVWKATDVRQGRTCALKILRPGLAGPNEVARLKREAALLASFSDPGIPRGFELFDDGQGTIALAMEFIDGTSLASTIGLQSVPPLQALAMVGEVARIVGVLHSKGVTHRDIKPGNIVVRPGWTEGKSGTVVLLDLGIARGTGQNATNYTSTNTAMGTFLYMPPESLLGVARDEQAMVGDVYAIGVLLWSLITGLHPTGLSMVATLPQLIAAYSKGHPFSPDPSKTNALESLVPGLVSVVARCLSLDPRARFSNANQFHEVIRGLRPNPNLSAAVQSPVSAPVWTGIVAPGQQGQQYTQAPQVQGWNTHALQNAQNPVAQAESSRFAPAQYVDPSRVLPTQVVKHESSISIARVLTLLGVIGGFLVVCFLGLFLVASSSRKSSPSLSSPMQNASPSETYATVVFKPTPTTVSGILRSGPSFSSSIVERLSMGSRVTVLSPSDSGGWVMVRSTSGSVGYMHRDILRF